MSDKISEQVADLERVYTLVCNALYDLRQAQVNYMADRGNQEKGKAVGKAAKVADMVLENQGIDPPQPEPKEPESDFYDDDDIPF